MADLVALALAGRPNSLVDLVLNEQVGPEHFAHARRELGLSTEALAALAHAEPEAAPPLHVRTKILASIAALQASRRPARAALLVVDMLNDHLSPGRPLEVPRARGIVPALVTRLDDARRAGIPVVYVCDRHDPHDADFDAWGAHNVEGTNGAEVWLALAPKYGDHVVHKATYSGFTRSTLDETLRKLHVDSLVLTGCLTEIGLLATATDALQRGYAVEIPPDAQAGATAATEQVALGLLRIMPPYGAARVDLLARLAT